MYIDSNKQILPKLSNIIEKLFGGDSIENLNYTAPMSDVFPHMNAIDCIYFLLEVLLTFDIEFSDSFIESNFTWSLNELAFAIQKCKRLGKELQL